MYNETNLQKFCHVRKFLISFSLIFLVAIAPLTAQNNTKTIDIEIENGSLYEFFNLIESETSYRFSYIKNELPTASDITVDVNNEAIEDILNNILTPRGLTYSRVNNNFAIKVAPPVKNITVTGLIVDKAGLPLLGATIIERGTHNGTTSNTDGEFSIVVPSNATLEVSYVSYVTNSQPVNGRSSIKFILEEDSELIDEVVVVGYGTQSKKLVTTSISKVAFDDIDTGAETDPMKMLQGRVSGVNISSTSGMPGATPNVQVRGVGSISGGSSPLYVVDGIPSEKYPNINPADIESMEVLKDASAAAIYGSRANAGVVIITTRSGKSGKTIIDVNGHVGVGTIANDIKMANTQEYINVMSAAVNNYNAQKGTNHELYIPTTLHDTDWVGEISRKMSLQGQGSVSLSGGNEKTTFYTSLGTQYTEGYLNTTAFEQYNMRAKFSHKINDTFKFNLNVSGSASYYDMVEEEATSLKVLRTAREEQPWATPYDENGEYNVNNSKGTLVRHNPVMLINEESWTLGKYQGSAVASFDVTPFKGFKYTPSFSVYGILDDEEKKLTDDHDARANSWAAISQQKDISVRMVFDNVFSYNNSYDRLTYSAMVGHSFERYNYERFGVKSDTYANGAFPSPSFGLVDSGANIYPGSFSYSSYALESYFSRIALNWDNRYVVNASARVDGSSRFSKGNRYGIFPSASFAWIIDQEEFFPSIKAISDAKLRLSWGQTGSMAGVGNYDTMPLVSSGGSYNGESGFQLAQDGRPLEWEKANQINVGMDLSLLDNRMTFTFDAFYQKTTDLLYRQPVVASTGYSTLQSNIGSMQNRGLEFALSGRVIDNRDFKFDLSGNISFVDNKLLSLIDGQDMLIVSSSGSNLYGGTMHSLTVGQPISTWYMYNMEGIYQYDSDVPEALYAKGVRAGDVRYTDVNKDGDITEADRMNVGKATPDFYGGINANMSYKNFDLNVFGQFSVGGKVMAAWRGVNSNEGTEHLGIGSSTRDGNKQYFNVSQTAATEYWNGPGTSNTMPRPLLAGVHKGYSYSYNTLTSTRYLEDASYFRLKTITLGYTLPKHITNKLKLEGLRAYVTADNLWTGTKYSGYDPESSLVSNPGSSNYGVDFGLQPTLRTVMFGINLKM